MLESANVPVLIAACGISTVCMGVFLVVFFMAIRFFAADTFEYITEAGRGLFGKDDERSLNPNVVKEQTARANRGNLSAKAQALDFDAAVAKYERAADDDFGYEYDERYQESPESPGSPPVDLGDLPERTDRSAPSDGFRSPRRDTRRRSRSDDEMFGGMLDMDGDGDLDY